MHLKYRFFKKWAVFAGPKLDFILDNDNDSFEATNYRFKNFGLSGEIGFNTILVEKSLLNLGLQKVLHLK